MNSSIKTIINLLISGLAVSMMLALTACGEETGTAPETSVPAASVNKDAETPTQPALSDERQQAYKDKVRAQMKKSLKNGLVRDYGITEEQADCLVENLSTSQLKTAQSDLEVQAIIEACGVDPSLIK